MVNKRREAAITRASSPSLQNESFSGRNLAIAAPASIKMEKIVVEGSPREAGFLF